jgi:hypothetical protein
MYPAYACLLGTKYSDKTKGIQTLAYIPDAKTAGLTDDKKTILREKLLSRCLGIMLEKLKASSFLGVVVTLSGGRVMTLYPRLLSYVADDPEQRQILCQYTPACSKAPCVQCYCARSQLCTASVGFTPPPHNWFPLVSGVEPTFLPEENDDHNEDDVEGQDQAVDNPNFHIPLTCMLRTASSQDKVRSAILNATTKSKKNAFKSAYSTRGLYPGVYGFAGMDVPQGETSIHGTNTDMFTFLYEPQYPYFVGDPQAVFHFDWLHNVDLGLMKMARVCISKWVLLKSGNGTAEDATKMKLDKAINLLPRYTGFYLPKQYFSSDLAIQSKEHRAVMEVRLKFTY